MNAAKIGDKRAGIHRVWLRLELWLFDPTLVHFIHTRHRSVTIVIITRNSAIADKLCNVFRGQSRSPNMVQFNMLDMVSY